MLLLRTDPIHRTALIRVIAVEVVPEADIIHHTSPISRISLMFRLLVVHMGTVRIAIQHQAIIATLHQVLIAIRQEIPFDCRIAFLQEPIQILHQCLQLRI